MLAKGYDDRLLFDRQHRRLRILRTGRQVSDRGPLLPLGNCLVVKAVALEKRSQALLTILYCSTDCRCRRGAAV